MRTHNCLISKFWGCTRLSVLLQEIYWTWYLVQSNFELWYMQYTIWQCVQCCGLTVTDEFSGGSGTSAILTAVCVAFGCRAKDIQRASILKDFIKTGSRLDPFALPSLHYNCCWSEGIWLIPCILSWHSIYLCILHKLDKFAAIGWFPLVEGMLFTWQNLPEYLLVTCIVVFHVFKELYEIKGICCVSTVFHEVEYF